MVQFQLGYNLIGPNKKKKSHIPGQFRPSLRSTVKPYRYSNMRVYRIYKHKYINNHLLEHNFSSNKSLCSHLLSQNSCTLVTERDSAFSLLFLRFLWQSKRKMRNQSAFLWTQMTSQSPASHCLMQYHDSPHPKH